MKLGDKYYLPLWDSVWKLTDKTSMQQETRLTFIISEGKNKGNYITRITTEDFEGQLIK